MKIIIDIGHPAHVHLFRVVAFKLINVGHEILFTYRERQHVAYLLTVYNFNKHGFGSNYKSVLGKIFGLFVFDLKMIAIGLRYKPKMFISHGSIYASHASFFLRVPHISLQDTFNMEQIRLSLPFTDIVLTGTYPHPRLGRKELQYLGYHELAYLHPEIFNPDENVLELMHLEKDQRYAIVRFVAWDASHDIGHKGMSVKSKISLVKRLSKYMKVFITSENELPKELAEYQISIPPERMHDALFFASLFVGESATMASESACLGTPAVYINDSQLGYIQELAGYGLAFSFTETEIDQQRAIEKAIQIAKGDKHLKSFDDCRLTMLADKINVAEFLFMFIHEYPKSIHRVQAGKYTFNQIN